MAPTTRPITSNCLQCLRKKTIPSSFSLQPRSRSISQYAATSAPPSVSPRRSTARPAHTRCLYNSSITYTQTRLFSNSPALRSPSSSSETSPPAEACPRGLVPLPHRRLIAITGKDTAKYLHGIVSTSVIAGSSMWSDASLIPTAFLNSKGRLREDALLYPWDSGSGTLGTGQEEEGRFGVLVEVDAGRVEELIAHLRKHRLRSKVKWRVLEAEEMGVWHVWDNAAGTDKPVLDTEVLPEGSRAFKDPRFQRFEGLAEEQASAPRNYRILHPGANGDLAELVKTPVREVGAYTLQRYIHGLAEGPTELPPASALPMEANMDILPAIDFHKGCYVGQELTIRTRHTGVIRKRILPVHLTPLSSAEGETASEGDTNITFPWNDLAAAYSPQAASLAHIPSGTDIKSPRGGRATGKMLGVVGNVGLALCRLEKMTEVQVGDEVGNIKPETGLVASWEEEGETRRVGVKAVVPPVVRRVYPE